MDLDLLLTAAMRLPLLALVPVLTAMQVFLSWSELPSLTLASMLQAGPKPALMLQLLQLESWQQQVQQAESNWAALQEVQQGACGCWGWLVVRSAAKLRGAVSAAGCGCSCRVRW